MSRCCLCGESEDCCLEFHHMDKDTKCFSIGKIPYNATLDDVKKELTKTICVCANCHRKIHNGIIACCNLCFSGVIKPVGMLTANKNQVDYLDNLGK